MKKILIVLFLLVLISPALFAQGYIRITAIEPIQGTVIKSIGETSGKVLTANGSGAATWTTMSFLPLAGGTLAGTLTGTSAAFSGDINVNGGDIFTTGTELKLNITSGTSQQALRVLRAGGWIDNKNSTFLQLGKASGADTAIISGSTGSMFNRLGIVSSYTTITSSHAYNAIPIPIANFNVYGTSYLNGAVTSTGTINSTGTGGWAIGSLSGTNRIDYTSNQFRALNSSDGYTGFKGTTFESTATDVPPFTVAGTLKVTNLNVDKLDDLDYSAFTPKVAYSFANGILIATDIIEAQDAMFTLRVEGNGYNATHKFDIWAQGYNYNSGNSIIQYRGHSLNYAETIYFFVYGGFLHIWLPQVTGASYQTLNCTVMSGLNTNAHNRVTGVTNAMKPTTGVTREVSFVCARIWTSANDGVASTLDADLLDGQHGSYYQTALTNPIILSGSATANYVTKFTGVGNAIATSTIYDNGNVGINNTNPSGKLDVIATTGVSDYPTLATAGLVVRDDTPLAANTGGTILFSSRYNSGGNYLHGAPYIRAYKENATEDDYRYGLKFGTRGTTSQQLSMTLTGNGSLLIGNVAPNGDDKLQINGTASGFPAEETNQFVTYGQLLNSLNSCLDNGSLPGTANYVVKFTDANSLGASSIFDDGSKVGIGTAAPATPLQIGTGLNPIGAGDNKTVNFGIVSRYSTADVKQYNVMGYYATTVDATDIFAQTSGETAKNFFTGIVSDASYFNSDRYSVIGNGIERLSVLQTGNVLINTPSDNTIDKLQVTGTASGTVDATQSGQFIRFGQLADGTEIADFSSVDAATYTRNGVNLNTLYQPKIYSGTTATAAATAAKTLTVGDGVTPLVAGDLLALKFTSGNSATSMTLTVNGVAAKNILLNNAGSNAVTATLNSNTVMLLYYDGTSYCMSGSFRTSDADTYDRMYWGANITAGAIIYDYKIVMQAADGKFYPLTTTEGTATTKPVSTQSFRIDSPILMYLTTTDVAANATFSNVYSELNFQYLNYTANASSFTSQLPIYLKGTIISDGSFKLDNTSFTSWLTQSLPTTDDGFVYILLGQMYSIGNIRINQYHPIYHYKNGKVTIYDSSAGSYLPLAGGTLTGDLKITESSPSLTFTSNLTTVLPSGQKEIEIPFVGWDGWDAADTVYNITVVSEPNGVFSPGAKVFELQGVSDAGKNSQMLRIAHNNGLINPMFKFKGNIAAYNKLGFFTDFTGDHVYEEPTTYVNRSGTSLQFTDPINGTVTLTKLKEAYDNHVVSAAFTGSSTKILTFTQKDLGTFTASFVDDIGSTYSDVYVNGGYFWAPNFTSSGSISFVNTTGQTITANLNSVAGLTPGSYTNANITVGSDGRLTLASSGSSGSSNWINTTNFSYFTDSGNDIGIGYTSDQGNYKLQVDGAIKASGIINGSVVYSDTWVSGAYGLTGNELVSKPSTPTAGTGQIYIKTDNKPYFQNDSGTEYDLTATGASDGNISNVSILADVMTFTGAGGGFNGTVPGLARENSQNDFTTYNTFAVSRAGSAVYVNNVNGLGTGVLATGGYLGVDANGATYDLELGQSGKIMIQTFAAAPASSSATGTTGTVIVTADYIFVCTATNTWKRVATSTW